MSLVCEKPNHQKCSRAHTSHLRRFPFLRVFRFLKSKFSRVCCANNMKKLSLTAILLLINICLLFIDDIRFGTIMPNDSHPHASQSQNFSNYVLLISISSMDMVVSSKFQSTYSSHLCYYTTRGIVIADGMTQPLISIAALTFYCFMHKASD